MYLWMHIYDIYVQIETSINVHYLLFATPTVLYLPSLLERISHCQDINNHNGYTTNDKKIAATNKVALEMTNPNLNLALS